MRNSVTAMLRSLRRQLERVVRKSRDKDPVRRALAMLQLRETGGCVAEVARRLCAARSSVHRWRGLFEDYGVQGLAPLPRGRTDYKANDKVLKELEKLLDMTPKDHGNVRSRWSSERLAVVREQCSGVRVHATSIRRWLKRLSYVWRRARPTLHIRDARKSVRMQAVNRALCAGERDPTTEVFYADEADVDLNPRMGRTGCLAGNSWPCPRRARIASAILSAP